MSLEIFRNRFNNNKQQHIDNLFEILRIRSNSASRENYPECRACAEKLGSRAEALGFDSEIIDTSGFPLLLATKPGNPDLPRLLIYGHYDVQPVDPIDAWQSPPFEPELRDGRIYARGAQDNKGQFSYVLAAIEDAITADDKLPTITLLIEGGEEVGSPGLTSALPSLKDKINADLLLVCDTNASDDGSPAIVAGLRGIVHLCARLRGPEHDLHSGVHGGTAPNPLQGMAHIISSFFNADGGIAIEGYLDDITPPSAEELALAKQNTPEAEDYMKETGAYPVGGDRTKSFAERRGFLPTIDINGLHGGASGDGMKTIIPAEAVAKISSRMVPGQDPAKCLDALTRHMQEHTPEGMQLTFDDTGVGGPGFRLDITQPIFSRARKVLDKLDTRGATLRWGGASIPIVSSLAETAQAVPLLIGFGSEKDRIHAPNESFSLEQFEKGYLFAALLLQELAEPGT